MSWSWRIGRFAGIVVQVHWTFLLLIAWLLFLHASRGDTLRVTVEGVGFVLALFACVVLHEFGHALAARRFGIRTRDITLFPIGGVARLERMPERPSQELWVAVAGPLVNVAIAIGLFAILLVVGGFGRAEDLTAVGGHFLEKLMWINLLLVAFNMLPAFPMDGGRVLRATLATAMGSLQATRIAATVGRVFAVGFAILGLFTNPLLLFIALFVFVGAGQEADAAAIRSVVRGVPVRDAMLRRFHVLRPDDTLRTAVDELLAGSQHDFPVVEQGRLVGLLTRDTLVRSLAESGGLGLVDQHMRRDVRAVEETAPLEDALARMRSEPCSTLVVVRDGAIVGMLTMENVGELLMVQSSLSRHG